MSDNWELQEGLYKPRKRGLHVPAKPQSSTVSGIVVAGSVGSSKPLGRIGLPVPTLAKEALLIVPSPADFIVISRFFRRGDQSLVDWSLDYDRLSNEDKVALARQIREMAQ